MARLIGSLVKIAHSENATVEPRKTRAAPVFGDLNFVRRFKVIVRQTHKKYLLRFSEIYDLPKPFRADKEGRFGQSSRNVGRGMQWTSRCRARELSCADERHLADDKGVWSWHPWAGAKRAEDDRHATVTKRSWTPGRARNKS
jgi:hypothetical protein